MISQHLQLNSSRGACKLNVRGWQRLFLQSCRTLEFVNALQQEAFHGSMRMSEITLVLEVPLTVGLMGTYLGADLAFASGESKLPEMRCTVQDGK